MENRNYIEVEMINQRFKDYKEMDKNLAFENIESLRLKTVRIASIYTPAVLILLIWWAIMVPKKDIIVLIFLIYILGGIINQLYLSIVTDIIISDKLKEIYKKAYYVHGKIFTPSSIERISEVFIKPEEIDDFLASLTSDAVLERRKCFKCQIEMHYVDYVRNNISTISMRQLEKIWKSPHIQLYCCRCYKRKRLFKKIKRG